MSSGGGGEGEGEGACESNVADSVARAPKRRRGGAETSGGGSVPGEGEGLR